MNKVTRYYKRSTIFIVMIFGTKFGGGVMHVQKHDSLISLKL